MDFDDFEAGIDLYGQDDAEQFECEQAALDHYYTSLEDEYDEDFEGDWYDYEDEGDEDEFYAPDRHLEQMYEDRTDLGAGECDIDY